MENDLYSLRGGFKKARTRKGLKQADVAEKMNVTLKTVMNWEQGISNPDIETAIKLAELFDCDLDYLTGRIEERNHDVHYVHEYTGLSAEAIEKISHPWTINDGSTTEKVASPEALALSHLTEAEGFDGFVRAYMVFLAAVDRLSKSVIPDDARSVIKTGEVRLRIDEATRFYMQDVSQAMLRLCESDFQKGYEECLKNSKHSTDSDNRRDE